MNTESKSDFKNKIEILNDLYQLISSIKDNNKKQKLEYAFNYEIDMMIDKVENYYYNNILLDNKNINNLKENERILFNYKKTLDKFLPYMLLYNITMNYE